MKSKVNWKRVILISVIAVAVAWVFVFGIPKPPNPKEWALGSRLIDLGYKVVKWEEDGYEKEPVYHLLFDWDVYHKSGGKALYVYRMQFDQPLWYWTIYWFSPEKGVWQDDDEIITPDSPMYQRLEEIRKKLTLPEMEDN